MLLNYECLYLCRELSVGRGSTATVGGGALPKINTVEPWDGKDGVVSIENKVRVYGCHPSSF